MRILLIKTSSMGDVIHSFPALTDAALAWPGLQVDWVVEEGFAELPRWHPAVDQVITVAIRRWRRAPWSAWQSGEWKRFRERLREREYDCVIDAQGLLKSAWLTRYAHGPVVGYAADSAREPLACHFYAQRYSVPWALHAIERIRQLLAQALGYPLPLGPGCYGLDRQVLPSQSYSQPYLVFLHGTTWASKHWPEPYWRQLAEQLSRAGWAIRLPWGNQQERMRAERIALHLPAVEVLPKLNLAGVAATIASAQACIAVDTGLGHLAAALDVPTISLYGPTRPGRIGTYGKRQIHLCASGPGAGSGDRQVACFDSLPPASVQAALSTLLDTDPEV